MRKRENRVHNATKQLQTHKEDCISNLPDDIIGHILSRLPTKHAMRTSVLSRDWKYKWTYIYDIRIDDHCRKKYDVTSFIRFVDRVLDADKESRIRSFRLICARNNMIHYHHIDKWISNVLRRGVQYLVVVAEGYDYFSCFIFLACSANCKSLVELKLSLITHKFMVCDLDCFPNLKRLYLDGLSILNYQFAYSRRHLLLKFPVLQILELKHCEFVRQEIVEIWAPELIAFKVQHKQKTRDYEIKIHGPKLAKFWFSGHYLDIYNLCAQSVYFVNLDPRKFAVSLASRADAILKKVSSLTCLQLSSRIVVALVRQEFVLPTLERLKRLEIEDSLGDKSWLVLLQKMPNLEHLNISFSSDYLQDENEPSEPLMLCVVSRLKEVKIFGFKGKNCEIDLISLFLENANKLERMFVYPRGYQKQVTEIEILCRLSTLAFKRFDCVTISERPRSTSFEQEISLEDETCPWN